MSYRHNKHTCSCKEALCDHRAASTTATSTPFVTAPSSPRHSHSSSVAHHGLTEAVTAACVPERMLPPTDFDFQVRIFAPESQLLNSSSFNPASTMSSAEELFQNGKIKPLDTSFYSYCTCFKHAAGHGGGYCDRLPSVNLQYANNPSSYPPAFTSYNGISMPPRKTEHIDAVPLQTSKEQVRAKLSSSETASDLWMKGAPAVGGNTDKGIPRLLSSETASELHWRKGAPVVRQITDKGTPRQAHPHLHEGRVIQISNLPLPSYSIRRGDGHRHRRSRSLSPLRVFHMDDMVFQPRPSFESELLYTRMSSRRTAGDPVDARGTVKPVRRRRSRRSWTLKELLNLGVADNRVHDKKSSQVVGKFPGNSELNAPKLAGKKGSLDRVENRTDHLEKGAGDNLNKIRANVVVEHAEEDHPRCKEAHYVAEEAKKRTLLPYKKSGLLACLGFTSKLTSFTS